MTRRLALLVAAAAALAACGSGAPAEPDANPDDRPLSEIGAYALITTEGEPLIDPYSMLDAAGYDAIPAVDEPVVLPAARADGPLSDTEQVMLVEHAGVARAYPVRSLISHEIVNDVIGGLPVAVTWCPLCNTGITFDRRVDGRAEVFGVSGGLYRSALVMFDRRTNSLWPQPLGKAVSGPLVGEELEVLPSSLLPWNEARDAHPRLEVVLASAQELEESENPYDGYDVSGNPFLFRGEVDERLPVFVRVAGVTFGGESQAWSYDLLRRRRAVSATVGEQPVVVLWAPGTVSPLESDDVREGRDVGSATVYDPRVDGRRLTFRAGSRTQFTDGETGSRWTLAGVAVDGPLKGQRLTPLPHQNAFWFAWAAFQPDTRLATR